jgi:hypothetical protein
MPLGFAALRNYKAIGNDSGNFNPLVAGSSPARPTTNSRRKKTETTLSLLLFLRSARTTRLG